MWIPKNERRTNLDSIKIRLYSGNGRSSYRKARHLKKHSRTLRRMDKAGMFTTAFILKD